MPAKEPKAKTTKDPKAAAKAKAAKAKAAKDPKAAKKDPKDPKVAKAPKDPKAAKKDPKAPKTPKDPKAPKTPKDPKAPKTPKEPKAPKAPKDPNAPKTPKVPRTPRDPKDAKAPAKDGKPKKLRPGKKKPINPLSLKKSRDLLNRRGRLYAKAIFSGFKRSQRNQYDNVALLKIEGALNIEHAKYYVGKKCAYMYKCKNGSYTRHHEKNHVRVLWGKITRPHGNTGSVRAKFTSNLPAYVMSRRIRIMLYPSTI